MVNESIERKIIFDEPASVDQFKGKGHERTAKALVTAIKRFEGNDRAIGLDGPWGSGKSTVVEIARRKLQEDNAETGITYNFFAFDIWQSQGSSFRRSFLEHILDWSKATFPHHNTELEEIEKKVKGKIRQVQSNNQSLLDWWGIIVLVFIPLLPVLYFWAKQAFDDAKNDRLAFMWSWPSVILYAFVAIPFAIALKRSFPGFRKLQWKQWRAGMTRYREQVSRVLLISAKQYEDQKVTQYIRETDPNDFEFQSILRDILAVLQNNKSRVILVLDNIDRLPRKEINEYWAQVRAVFSSGPLARKLDKINPVTAIVPYDRRMIEEGYKESKGEKGDTPNKERATISSLGAREIFSKTFDEILNVSPPVMSNSREFFMEKIGQALPNFAEDDQLFRVYQIFDRILRNENGNATPRQIISFINELTGLYVLHERSFQLPTVAVFIAYQDALEANPQILANANCIDERVRAIASDIDIDRNLAAMIFNVEPELALQLLLDNKIRDASVGQFEDLAALSKIPGFDIRVDEVLKDNVKDWQGSKEFASVVQNFADLAPQYSEGAKAHFSTTLVDAFENLPSFKLSERNYQPLLRSIELATESQLPKLVVGILGAGMPTFDNTAPTVEGGQEWAEFVGTVKSALNATNSSTVLDSALKQVPLPQNPAFMFGVASATLAARVPFAQFLPKPLTFADGDTSLEALAVDRSAIGRDGFAQFHERGLIKDDKWAAIASALVDPLISDKIDSPNDFVSQLNLLADIDSYIGTSKTRALIPLSTLFESAQFYENLKTNTSGDDDLAIGSAIFLSILLYSDTDLPTPKKIAANGTSVAADTKEYSWFDEFFRSSKSLTSAQHDRIAELATRAAVTFSFYNAAKEDAGNTMAASVLRSAFTKGEMPRWNLKPILEAYGYLGNLLGDELKPMLQRYQARVTEKELDTITLDLCAPGILTDTHNLGSPRWEAFHQTVEKLLRSVPLTEWPEHLAAGNIQARVLFEKISSSGVKFDDSAFRTSLQKFYLDTLAGETTVVDQGLGYDSLLETMDEKFRPDFYRTLREDLRDVSVAGLYAASNAFLETIRQVLTSGDRLTAEEKDNVVRYLLCTAVESNNTDVLNIFIGIGRKKISGYINSSKESTQEKLEGAWSTFASKVKDRTWSQTVGEFLHGKKKARSLSDIFWGIGRDDQREKETDDEGS